MTREDALDLLAPIAPARGGRWLDVGAGTGRFSRALATLLGPEGEVVALDRDPEALRELESRPRLPGQGRITGVQADFERLDDVAPLRDLAADGLLFANALHFSRAPGRILSAGAAYLLPRRPLVVVEYDRRIASPWVPYPLPTTRLAAWARAARWAPPRIVARRPSAYGGDLYVAVLSKPDGVPAQEAGQ